MHTPLIFSSRCLVGKRKERGRVIIKNISREGERLVAPLLRSYGYHALPVENATSISGSFFC